MQATRTAPAHAVSRRTVLKALGALPLAGAATRLRAGSKARVLVIGAGLSGLNAALLLEEQGIDVQVIEGRDRVGGRVLSHRDLPGNPESGGTSFGPGYARLMDACRRFRVGLIDLTPIVPLLNERTLILGGEVIPRSAWAGHPRNPFPEPLRQVPPWAFLNPVIGRNNPLRTPDAWVNPAHAKYDIPLHAWLRSLGVSDDAIELCWNTNPAYGTSAHDVSAMMVMAGASFATMQAQLGGQVLGYAAVGGNQAIAEAMAGGLKNPVQFGREVTGIRSGDTGVDVACADGTTYGADRVICSIPMAVLRRVRLDPLPVGTRHLAINTLASQPLNLLHLAVRKPYWESDGLEPHQFSDSLAGMMVAERNARSPKQVTSLTVWIRGRNATWMDTLAEEAAVARVMDDFYRIRPAARGAVEVRAYKSWYRDPFAAGDWAVWAPGQVAAFATEIGRPHGRIHFCGEHTAVSNRGMEGAMESGERAAFEVLALV